MADEKSMRDPKSLEARALEILAERHEGEDLTVVGTVQDVVLSSKMNLFMVHATKKDEPNGPHYTVVVDGTGAEVNLESLSEREGMEFFATPKLAADPIVIGPAAAPAASITIDPNVNDLVLHPDETLTESIVVCRISKLVSLCQELVSLVTELVSLDTGSHVYWNSNGLILIVYPSLRVVIAEVKNRERRIQHQDVCL